MLAFASTGKVSVISPLYLEETEVFSIPLQCHIPLPRGERFSYQGRQIEFFPYPHGLQLIRKLADKS